MQLLDELREFYVFCLALYQDLFTDLENLSTDSTATCGHEIPVCQRMFVITPDPCDVSVMCSNSVHIHPLGTVLRCRLGFQQV